MRIQWDPEKDILLQPLPYRSIQLGLSGIAVEKYISDWIVEVDDITESCRKIHQLVIKREINEALQLLPVERKYFLPDEIAQNINSQ